jgi:hypothetical protein
VIPIPDRYPVETILIEPRRRNAQPSMTIIHGGPHGQFATAFAPAFAVYALQGCMIHKSVFLSTLLAELTSPCVRHLEYA